jgi:hypothetical protein
VKSLQRQVTVHPMLHLALHPAVQPQVAVHPQVAAVQLHPQVSALHALLQPQVAEHPQVTALQPVQVHPPLQCVQPSLQMVQPSEHRPQ